MSAYLKVPAGEARQALEERVVLGTTIQERPLSSQTELESVQSAFAKWDDYNRDLLGKLFQADELRREYDFHPSSGWAIDAPLEEDVRRFRIDVRERISKLESFMERIPLMEPAGVTHEAVPLSTARRPTTDRSEWDPRDHPVIIYVLCSSGT